MFSYLGFNNNVDNNSMDVDNYSNNIINEKLPYLPRTIGLKLDSYLNNVVNNRRKVIRDIHSQSLSLLKCYNNNLLYIWIIYDDFLELISYNNDDNDIKVTFQLKYDNTYGTYSRYQFIDTKDGDDAFISFHFIKGKVYNILPLDTRYVLYFAEKVRLGLIGLQVSSSKIIPITDGTKNETATIDISSVRLWGNNLYYYDRDVFSNIFPFSFNVTVLNSTTKMDRSITFISEIEQFARAMNHYGAKVFMNPSIIFDINPKDKSEIIILNDGDVVKFGKPYPHQISLWKEALKLKSISPNREKVILYNVLNIQDIQDENLKRKILLECSVCIGLNSIISEFIQGSLINEETGIENYILDDIVAIQQWAIGSNMPRNVEIGGLNMPHIVDDVNFCSKISLKEHLELQVGKLLRSSISPLLLQKNGPGLQGKEITNFPIAAQMECITLLNDIQCLGSLIEALLRRKESQSQNFLQENDAETEHDLIIDYINLKMLEVQSLSQMLQLCLISCEHPNVSLTYLLLPPDSIHSRNSCRVPLDFTINNWIPNDIMLIGQENHNSYLFEELVSRLDDQACCSRVLNTQDLSVRDAILTISELLLLPFASIRSAKSFSNAIPQVTIAQSILIHILLDSMFSTMSNSNDINIDIINNFALDLGDAASLPNNIQQGIVGLWKLDHGIDHEGAISALCAPKVNISADVVMFYQISRILLLSTKGINYIPARNFLMSFTPFKETLDPVKGIIAFCAAMATLDTWEIGWHTSRRLCTFLDRNLATEARKKIALLLCKWSDLHERNLDPFLKTVMLEEEQLQVADYLGKFTEQEIIDKDENSRYVNITFFWLLYLEKFHDAKVLHERHKEALRIASDRSSIDMRESIINSMLRFPSISKRNYNIFRPYEPASTKNNEVMNLVEDMI